jgi:Spy/CpxP family protein refolding chaperone
MHQMHRPGPIFRFLEGQLGRWLVFKSEFYLTPEQWMKIHGIVQAHGGELVDAMQGVWQKRDAFRSAVLADKPNEAAIRKAADDLGKALGTAGVATSKVVVEVRPVLTDEQRALLRKFYDDTNVAVAKLFVELHTRRATWKEKHEMKIEKPAVKPATPAKPAEKVVPKTVEKTMPKTVEKTMPKSVEKTMPKTVEKTVEKKEKVTEKVKPTTVPPAPVTPKK